MKKMAIGLMSGTSLDGLDLFIGTIDEQAGKTHIEKVFFKTYSYEPSFQQKILKAMSLSEGTPKLLSSLNLEIAKVYSECIFASLAENNLSSEDISFIASHGQTIYHITKDMDGSPSSLQLGDGSALAALTNIPVVSNFRNADIAVGGEGAPLVPFVHHKLLQSTEKNRVIQNIGGISNATFLPKNSELDQVVAFDNGPGNMMIDYAMSILYHQPYDLDGKIASSGNKINQMYDEVLSLPYFKKLPPKSTGRELFGNEFTSVLLTKYSSYKKEDIIHTLSIITADSIASSIEQYLPMDKFPLEVVLCGGGASNPFLVERLRKQISFGNVIKVENIGYDSNSFEALAFMVLGNETMNHRPSNVPSATGATKKVILGQISPVWNAGEER
ncbi:MAG: anhydro-N-acetylmuramic acid kinase AnmK [Candidatus Izemoplasmatales bacterium]